MRGHCEPRTLRGRVLYFLPLGSAGFGGPIALVGMVAFC